MNENGGKALSTWYSLKSARREDSRDAIKFSVQCLVSSEAFLTYQDLQPTIFFRFLGESSLPAKPF